MVGRLREECHNARIARMDSVTFSMSTFFSRTGLRVPRECTTTKGNRHFVTELCDGLAGSSTLVHVEAEWQSSRSLYIDAYRTCEYCERQEKHRLTDNPPQYRRRYRGRQVEPY